MNYPAGLDGKFSLTRHPYTNNTSRQQKTSSRIPSHGISISQTRHSQKHFNQILTPKTAALFHIKQLPRNIISWILSIAEASTLPMALTNPLRPRSLATGIGGAHSSKNQALQTNSWGGSHNSRGQSLCNYSPTQCKETSLPQPENKYSSTELSIPPYWMYLRTSGRTFGAT